MRRDSDKNDTPAPGFGLLSFDAFERYCRALSRAVVEPHKGWDAVRSAFKLDPEEILVRQEVSFSGAALKQRA